MTVAELIRQLGGRLIRGDAETRISLVSSAEAAEFTTTKQSVLTFGDTPSDAEKAVSHGAGATVVPEGYEPEPWNGRTAVIADKQPRLWFAKAARLMQERPLSTGIHPSAVVATTAELGDEVCIGAGAIVGEQVSIRARTRIEDGAVIGQSVEIGEDCRVHPRAVLYRGTKLGSRVIIHAGAVLGADGFGYVRDKQTGGYTQFPQIGRVVIEDDVEIGANTTIDRGALSETRIRRGTKVDNLVHIGHNCDIGEDVVIAAQVGISGSSTVGKGAVLAGQVGIGDHAHVGSGVILGGQAGVLSGKTITRTGTVLWGTPAKPLREYLREVATLSRLSRRKKE